VSQNGLADTRGGGSPWCHGSAPRTASARSLSVRPARCVRSASAVAPTTALNYQRPQRLELGQSVVTNPCRRSTLDQHAGGWAGCFDDVRFHSIGAPADFATNS